MAGEWIAQLSDDLKDNEAFTPYETLSDLAKAHLDSVGKVTELDGNATTLKGKVTDLEGRLANSIPKLADDATDEDKATFFNKLGRPEAPENYEFQRPELPDDIEYDENIEKEFRSVAHGVGLTKAQAEGLYNWFNSTVVDAYKAVNEVRQKSHGEAVDSLKKEWGENYEKNVEIAKRAAKSVETEGIKDFQSYLDESGFGDNIMLIRAFHLIGMKILEDTSAPGGPSGEKGLKETPEGRSAAEEKVLKYPSMET